MTMVKEKVIALPLRGILVNIAESKGIKFRDFTEDYFYPEKQGDNFPVLSELAGYLKRETLDIGMKERGFAAFEGSNDNISLSYFGGKIPMGHNQREYGLICNQGRRIHVFMGVYGKGRIQIDDDKSIEARYKLGEESFECGRFDKDPKGEYFFDRVPGHEDFPRIRDFLEFMLK